jgi:hypothetical protein
MRKLAWLLFFPLALAGAAGCYAEAQPAAVTSADVGVWEPAYYDGYLVYYDDWGRPYYYGPGGAVLWVSPASPYYAGLTYHWRVYGHAYPHWYHAEGWRYRGYRASPGYHAYHGYHGGPVYHGAPAYHGAPPAHRR